MKKIFAILLTLMMLLSCVVVTSAAETKSVNIAGMGTVVIEQMTPVSGGNRRFPRIITDGRIPTEEEPYIMQWDTFRNGSAERDTYFGVTFTETYTITGVDFTEGLHYEPVSGKGGGWFANGDIGIEVLLGTEWTPVALINDPKYPNSNKIEDFGKPYETYELRIAPTECLGIRVIGAAGGDGFFASCAELAVLADVPTTFEVVDPWLAERAASAKERYETKRQLEGYATPVTDGKTYGNSGCSHTLTVINDGVFVEAANTNLGLQFDTYNPNTKVDIEEYIGYTFDAPYRVESLKFQEGVSSASGGFFSFSFYVEALIHGEWVELENVKHDYPDSNMQSDFTSNAIYEIDFDDVVCEGIRLIGIAGGSKNYISCAELAVIGDMNPDLTDYNASAGQQPGGDDGKDDGEADTTKKPAANDKEDKADATTAAATTAKATDATTKAAEEEKGGCGSVIGMSALAMVAVIGGAVLVKRKED